jgi:hypothetical protein
VLERLLVGWIAAAASSAAGRPAIYTPREVPPPPIVRAHVPIPPAPSPAPAPARIEVAPNAPTATELAQLYVKTARELSALERAKGTDAAIDLWPRFRWIRLSDALTSLPQRIESYQILDQLRRDVAAAD